MEAIPESLSRLDWTRKRMVAGARFWTWTDLLLSGWFKQVE